LAEVAKGGTAVAIEQHLTGRTLVVRLQGELDLVAAEEFRREVEKALDQSGARTLLLNLSQVSFIDSSGLGAILGRYRRMSQQQGRVILVGAGAAVLPILELSGLLRIIAHYETEHQALAAS